MGKKRVGLAAPGSMAEPAAAVIDLDNFQLMGGGRKGRLNSEALADELRDRGVETGVMLAETFYPKEYMRLRRLGFRAVATTVNADDFVVAYARRMTRKYNKLFVLTGDGELGLRILADAGTCEVEFWAHSWKLSSRLWAAAGRVRFIDGLVEMPRRGDWAALAGRSKPAASVHH